MQTITEHTQECGRKACIICKEHFISLNHLVSSVVKVVLKCGIRFSISLCWCSFPKFCTQISCPLAYGVCISSKANTTAVWLSCKSTLNIIQLHLCFWLTNLSKLVPESCLLVAAGDFEIWMNVTTENTFLSQFQALHHDNNTVPQ